MNFRKIALSLLVGASSLLAIDAVTNLSVSAPHNSGTTTNDASIDFTWTPPTGVSKYYYKLDTNSTNYDLVTLGGYSTLNSSSATSLTATATASGDYYLHLVAADAISSSAPKLVPVTSSIDIDKGTVTVTPDGGSLTTSTNSISLTGSETGTIYYTLDGTTPTTSSSVYSTALTVGVSATLKTLLKDSAGNVGDVVSKVFTIANNPTVLKSNDNTAVDGKTITTSTTTALKVSGTDLTRYKFKKSTASTWTTVNDINTTIDISTLSSGSHTYYILGGDAYNFQADTAKTTVTFTVDDTAPSSLKVLVNSVEANENNASTVTFADNFTFTLTSNESGASIRYTTDGSTPSKTAGTLYSSAVTTTKTVSSGSASTFAIKLIAYDTAGNLSNVKSVNVTIDKEQPTLTMPTTKSFSSSFDATISSDDSAATIYYLVSNSATTTVDGIKASGVVGTTATIGKNPSTSQEDGTYKYLHALAVDVVGNGDEDATDVKTVTYSYDTTAVTLNLSGVTEDATIATVATHGATPTTSISVSGDNFTYYKYKFNDSNLSGETSMTLSSSPTISLSSLTDGNYTLYIGADTNSSGDFNLSEQNLSFVVDNTPSSTVTVSDVNYTTPTYTITLDKPSDATTLYYSTNGGTTYTSTTASQTLVELTQDVNSSTTVSVKTADAVGNESNVTSASYTREAAKTKILSASGIVFDSQANYASSSKNVTVSNTGNSQVTIYSTTLSSSDFKVSSDTCNGNIVAAGSTCIVTVDFNATNSGAKTATMTLQYNGTDATELNVTMSGTSTNNAPVVVTTDDVNTTEDSNITGVLTATDIDSSSLSFNIDTNTTHGTIVLDTNGSFTYSPTANFNGTDWFIFNVTDGESNSTDTNITINVTAVNDLPTVEVNGSTASSISIETADGNFTISYDANDTIDDENVTVTVNDDNADGNVTLDTNAKTLTYLKDANATRGTGKYFTVIFSDGSGVDVNRTVNISLNNAIPTLTIDANVSSLSMNEDGNSSNNTIVISDGDGDNITISIETAANNGTATLSDYSITGDENSTTYTYTPTANFYGTDSFVLKFDDGFGGIFYQTINISVANTNDAPTWNTTVATQTTAEDTDLNVTLDATDIDPSDTITYSADANSSMVDVTTVNGSILTIKPVANQNGIVTITVTATDASEANVTQSFDLNITAVDDAPTITPIAPQRAQIGDANISVEVNATDIDNDTITYDINTSDATVCTVEINSTGVITIDPLDVNGTATITVIAITADANTTSTFSLTVKDTNVTFDKEPSSSSYDSETNTTITEFALESARLELNENDNGKVSATLDGNRDVNLTVDVVGANISVATNGTLSTQVADSNVTKTIEVKVDGNVNGTLKNEDNTTTEIAVTIDEAVNTSIKADSIVTTFIKSGKSVTITIKQDGTVTPTITGAVLPTSDLPAGTKTTVTNDDKIKFEFSLPSTLEFN